MTLVKFANGNKSKVVNPLLTDVFDSFFNDAFADRVASRVPAVNIGESDSNYHLELAVPGMKKEDFKITLDKNRLTVSGENNPEDAGAGVKYSRREYTYSSFSRSFTLPDTVDYNKIDAEYTDGILKLSIAKKEEAKIQSREIAVK